VAPFQSLHCEESQPHPSGFEIGCVRTDFDLGQQSTVPRTETVTFNKGLNRRLGHARQPSQSSNRTCPVDDHRSVHISGHGIMEYDEHD
jgi:hypothetical protein